MKRFFLHSHNCFKKSKPRLTGASRTMETKTGNRQIQLVGTPFFHIATSKDTGWYAEPLIGLDLICLVLIGLDLICLVLIGYQYC